MSPEPTLPVSQPMTAKKFATTKEWFDTLGLGCSDEVTYWMKFAEAYAAHVTAERDRELQQAREELQELRIISRTQQNLKELYQRDCGAAESELSEAREANELIQRQMRTLNEECSQLRKDCIKSGEEIAQLKEALTNYGVHKWNCKKQDSPRPHKVDCTCGFSEALHPVPEKTNMKG